MATNQCLDVAGKLQTEGAQVQQWTCNGQDNQLWKLGAAPPTAPTTPPQTTWTYCSAEWSVCNFSGTRQVRFGAPGSWAVRTATASIECNFNVFGDPNPGYDKTCEVESTTEPTPTCTPPQVLQNGQCVPPTSTNSPMPTIAGTTTEQQAFWNNFNTTMILRDEFDGSSLDTNIWKHGTAYDYAPSNPGAVQVTDGKLRLVVPGGEVGISSRERFRAGYFIEGRARLPTGPGVWPAFWLIQVDTNGDPCSSRSEPDIFEAYPGMGGDWNGPAHPDFGGITANRFDFTHHPVSNAGGCTSLGRLDKGFDTSKKQPPFNLSLEFATYGMWHRKDGQVEFYLNGVKELESSTHPVLAERLLEIIINNVNQSRTGIPNTLPISSAPQDNRNALEFDYVRVWSQK